MPPAQHAASARPSFTESPLTRLATLAVVGALGATGLAATATHSGASGLRLSAAVAEAHPGATPVTPVAPVTRTAQARPAVAAPHPPARPVASVRYIPNGTGMWLYEWRRSNHGDAHSIVRRARRTGLSTLYLRTGSSWDGFSGRTHLTRLLSATRGTDVHVVAWDFPRLRRPKADAHRLALAARVHALHGEHVSAVAPDIETPAEGTFNAGWRVRTYLRVLRASLPKNVSILAAVPWPSRYRIGNYPYASVAHHSDVLVPMAYWYNNRPDDVTAKSIRYLRRYHRPVQPVGQGYDGKLDVPSLRHNNLRRQVPAFFKTARRHGAQAVSLWSWQAAPRSAWHALRNAHRLFAARR